MKIENPLTKMKTKNRILKALAVVMTIAILVLIPVVFYKGYGLATEYYHLKVKENQQLRVEKTLQDEKIQNSAKEIEAMKKKLEEKNEQLRHLKVTSMIIEDDIRAHNPALTETEVRTFAQDVVKHANDGKYSAYMHSSLISSECSWHKYVTHALPYVIGMGGINTRSWTAVLKKENIIRDVADLKDPRVNIRASAFIFKTYLSERKTVKGALACYKGYSPLGISQAQQVIAHAVKLKSKEAYYMQKLALMENKGRTNA